MKTELNVWTYPYTVKHYLTHPWKWFYDTYWNFRNWIHRANHGFAYVDVWNFGTWFPKVGSLALKYLKENGKGYPGNEVWDTHEKWILYLNYLSERLKWCSDSIDSTGDNEYFEEFDKMMDACAERLKDRGLGVYELTEEEKEIRDKYFARQKEIEEENNDKRQEIFREIGEMLPKLWE